MRFRGTEKFDAGSKVAVHTKGGAIKTESVGKCIWSGADRDGGPVSLYTIQGNEKQAEQPKQAQASQVDDDAGRWDDFR